MRRGALLVELALSVALVVLIGVAGWKLQAVSGLLGVGRVGRIAFALAFLAAAAFAARRAGRVVRLLRSEDDATHRR